MQMARFDVKFSRGFAARKEKVARVQNDYERQIGMVKKLPYQTINQFADQFQQRFSQFQSIAAIMDLANKPLIVDPQ